MNKRFKTYARKRTLFTLIIYFILGLIGFILAVKILFDKANTNNNILSLSTNTILSKLNLTFNNKIDSLLKMSFFENVSSDDNNYQEVIKNTNNDPIIYIYNTHQTEEYAEGNLKEYNIKPTVYMASNLLKNALNNYKINAIVEDENMVNILKANNWSYNDTYKVSMNWLKQAKEKYPTLKYFIDLHRDSVTTRITINDKEYAKLMFVVGMNHENYEQNETLVKKLNEYLNNNYNGLMRNIFYGKRSQYNQDFDPNTILIEVGGPNNNIIEVQNSINALADALAHEIGVI